MQPTTKAVRIVVVRSHSNIITNYIKGIIPFRKRVSKQAIKNKCVLRGIIGETLINFSTTWKKVGNGITRVAQRDQAYTLIPAVFALAVSLMIPTSDG